MIMSKEAYGPAMSANAIIEREIERSNLETEILKCAILRELWVLAAAIYGSLCQSRVPQSNFHQRAQSEWR